MNKRAVLKRLNHLVGQPFLLQGILEVFDDFRDDFIAELRTLKGFHEGSLLEMFYRTKGGLSGSKVFIVKTKGNIIIEIY
jgi:hypothetical protein